MQGNLRLGFSRQTVLAALGQAAVYNEEHSKPPPNTKNPLDEVCFFFFSFFLSNFVSKALWLLLVALGSLFFYRVRHNLSLVMNGILLVKN